ncbi:NAD(P)-binding domain-containing protein [Streptomyces sp. SID5785]|uniref:flavin-containing monooxygenase n=1 Tax=Streptomyces sp. SID5785 TaxID=2690309 RepID=UPI00136123F1|nr:NAD(P)/FAD-dependent oxidoreductase [Streptomyces sp. SID5785]MZD10416.1 NAD(P)-binding domain-containing protein [Streptomyces sp. SID5785]
MEHTDLIIIGAGQAGLATAALARRYGFGRPLLLEAAAEPAGSWPDYYDSLTLFSPARYSMLPGLTFPGNPDRYPTRDEVVDYLRQYATRLDADVRTRTRVTSVRREGGAWIVTAEDGTSWSAPAVIAATGNYSTPNMPVLPGQDAFTGRVLHAAEYRGPEPFDGQRVVVVGGGNSAVQIAAELGAVAEVSLATRRPLGWMPQTILGRDLHWWLKYTRLDVAPIRRWLEKLPVSVLDDGRYRAALDRHGVDQRSMFARYEADGVVWDDGTKERVDAVLLATGYQLAFPYLEGTGALDHDGQPLHRGGVASSVPGLGFVGIEFQRSFSSKTLRGVGRDAGYVLARLRR